MRVGYARVSTIDQDPELQLEALRCAGCEKVFTEKASGARDDRPELARILTDVLRAGDTLVVWKLDRRDRWLARRHRRGLLVPRSGCCECAGRAGDAGAAAAAALRAAKEDDEMTLLTGTDRVAALPVRERSSRLRQRKARPQPGARGSGCARRMRAHPQ